MYDFSKPYEKENAEAFATRGFFDGACAWSSCDRIAQNDLSTSFEYSKGGSVESEAGNGSSSPRGKASDGIPRAR